MADALGSPDMARFRRQMKGARDEMAGAKAERRLVVAGKVGVDLVRQAVKGDIGDESMSNWWRAKPVQIKAEAKVMPGLELRVRPQGRARGPMRVLTDGRREYSAGDFRVAGKRIRKRDGAVVDKRRRVRRRTGATEGKGTWTEATRLLNYKVGQRFGPSVVSDVAARFRRGG